LPTNTPHLTVFGNQKQRTDLAILVLTFSDLELGFLIIVMFKLPPMPIVLSAIQQLTLAPNISLVVIEELIEHVSHLNLTDDEHDEVVLAAIRGLSLNGQPKAAELFIAKLHNDSARVLAFAACGRTATAALLAERIPNVKASLKFYDDAPSSSKTNGK